MASQVEIASSSPFGCVLRDHNRRDGCNGDFQGNIKNFVRDHLNTCNFISSDSETNENTQRQSQTNNNPGSWVSRASKKFNNNLGNLRFSRSNHNNGDKDESSLASLISPRHSRLLDRWAARQAREMVSTLENEAELLSQPNSENLASKSSREDPPAPSDSNSKISTATLGASSLVQIWEKRLNQSNGTSKSNTPVSTGNSSPSNNGSCCSENAFSLEEQSRISVGSSSEEPFPDWESDKTGPSDQSCSPRGQCSSSDVAESERVRVADIIKRLTATKQMQGSTSVGGDDNDHELCSNSVTGSPCRERDSVSTTEHSEHNRAFLPQFTSSPRIRGRRAFNDLLMQMERDRHGELNNLAERRAVSKFTQRGRIQSSLRLRLLQRGAAAEDQCSQKSTPSESEVNRQPQGSAILHLRERFSTGAEVANPRSPRKETVNNAIQLDNSPTPNQLSKDTCIQTMVRGTTNHCTESSQESSMSQTGIDHNKEEAYTSSDVSHQKFTRFEDQRDDSLKTAETTPSVTASSLNEMAHKMETSNQQYAMAETSSYEEIVEEEEATERSYDEIVEELEANDQNYDEASYDWISHISRPRSYWEERRQAWYTEMLNNGSDKDEIRKLLERRTVSTVLSSDFRERMDRLMESHRGTQTQLVNSQDDEVDNQGRMDQLIAFLQEHICLAGQEGRRNEEQDEEEEGEEEEEEKAEEQEPEGKSLISGSYREVSDYSNQSSPPTLLRTWSFRDNEGGDDFDRVPSTSSPPSQSQTSYQDSRQYSASTNHHSIEMELIYDLREHMEQLYHEISELRKSIKSCMDMQMQLQQSMNQEIHTVKEEEKKLHAWVGKKGNCRICYEKKVDSLLYRCGHMCACLKCANELQWNSGKCPVCRAKIDDVVRVYVDV